MCGRFNQSEERSLVERTLRTDLLYNISPGMPAVIETTEGAQIGLFGFRPAWDQKKLFINARCEGKSNEHDATTGWQVGIHTMPSFRGAFKSRRCAVPVTGFLEGPQKERLKKPFLFSKNNQEEFYLAAIYEPFINEETGEELPSFAILTTPANILTSRIQHHRSPLMLHSQDVRKWIDSNTEPKELFSIVLSGYVEPGISITPLYATLVTSGKLHTKETMEPAGEPVSLEY